MADTTDKPVAHLDVEGASDEESSKGAAKPASAEPKKSSFSNLKAMSRGKDSVRATRQKEGAVARLDSYHVLICGDRVDVCLSPVQDKPKKKRAASPASSSGSSSSDSDSDSDSGSDSSSGSDAAPVKKKKKLEKPPAKKVKKVEKKAEKPKKKKQASSSDEEASDLGSDAAEEGSDAAEDEVDSSLILTSSRRATRKPISYKDMIGSSEDEDDE